MDPICDKSRSRQPHLSEFDQNVLKAKTKKPFEQGKTLTYYKASHLHLVTVLVSPNLLFSRTDVNQASVLAIKREAIFQNLHGFLKDVSFARDYWLRLNFLLAFAKSLPFLGIVLENPDRFGSFGGVMLDFGDT